MQGSLIQLADGSLKRVEDLQTEDFLRSADASADVRIDRSTVVRLERPSPPPTSSSTPPPSSVLLTFSVGRARVQVRVEAALEHPFYVFERGWASCAPELTQARYQLPCRPLQVGDVCISLTHKGILPSAAAEALTINYPAEVSLPPFSPPSATSSPLPPLSSRASSSSLPTKSLSLSSSSKQVAFHEVPSIYCINTDSPPNQRSAAACSSPLPPPPTSSSSLSSPTVGSTWTTTAESAAKAATLTPVSPSPPRRTSKLKVENHTHKPKTTF